MEPEQPPPPPPPALKGPRIQPRLADSLLTAWAAMGLTAALGLFREDLKPEFYCFVFLCLSLVLFIGTAFAWQSSTLLAHKNFRQRLPIILLCWLGPLSAIASPVFIGLSVGQFRHGQTGLGLLLVGGGLLGAAAFVTLLVINHRANRILYRDYPAARKPKHSVRDLVVPLLFVSVFFLHALWPLIKILVVLAGFAAGGYALYRLGQTFAKSRPRLRDWLVAVWLAGGWTALARLVVGPNMERYGWILVTVGLSSFLGSVWAWSAADRRKMASGKSRLLLSLLGSAGAVVVVGAGILIYLESQVDYYWPSWPRLNAMFGLLTPLLIGAMVMVELPIRRISQP